MRAFAKVASTAPKYAAEFRRKFASPLFSRRRPRERASFSPPLSAAFRPLPPSPPISPSPGQIEFGISINLPSPLFSPLASNMGPTPSSLHISYSRKGEEEEGGHKRTQRVRSPDCLLSPFTKVLSGAPFFANLLGFSLRRALCPSQYRCTPRKRYEYLTWSLCPAAERGRGREREGERQIKYALWPGRGDPERHEMCSHRFFAKVKKDFVFVPVRNAFRVSRRYPSPCRAVVAIQTCFPLPPCHLFPH